MDSQVEGSASPGATAAVRNRGVCQALGGRLGQAEEGPCPGWSPSSVQWREDPGLGTWLSCERGSWVRMEAGLDAVNDEGLERQSVAARGTHVRADCSKGSDAPTARARALHVRPWWLCNLVTPGAGGGERGLVPSRFHLPAHRLVTARTSAWVARPLSNRCALVALAALGCTRSRSAWSRAAARCLGGLAVAAATVVGAPALLAAPPGHPSSAPLLRRLASAAPFLSVTW
eukprot:scaffold865_cov312-Prasinococcus_capsulatus_cf.AAC.9